MRERRVKSKVDDLEALKQRFEVEVNTPKVEAKLRQGYEATKELSVRIAWQQHVFQVVWPSAYPDGAPLSFTVTKPSLCNKYHDFDEVNVAVSTFCGAFEGINRGYASEVVDFAIDLMSDIAAMTPPQDMLSLVILKFNHLLLGNEHKKEKSMMAAAKKTFLGGVCYGTPGLIILLGANDDDVSHFLIECRAIGKKGVQVYTGESHCDFRAADAVWSDNDLKLGRGFVELSSSQVQDCMGGLDKFKRYVLNMS